MKVLLLGATGNLGSRLIPALLTHDHTTIAFVRSATKLAQLLPQPINEHLHVIEGDAKDATAVKQAVLDNACDAVVSTAGLAALAPWSKSDLPEIFRAVLTGVREAGEERGRPVRVWFLGGFGVLFYPGSETMISNYIPIYLAHRQNLRLLRTLSPDTVDWSMLCPMTMISESSDLSVPTKKTSPLMANASVPPAWRQSWMQSIPLVGRFLTIGMNASRYETTLEQNAEFIADDLESAESRWSGVAVGIIDGSK